MEKKESKYQIVFGYKNMDFTKVTEMLTNIYWSIGIGEAEVRKAASNSALLVGVFVDGIQIGYGRVISDKTRFAYLTDIIIDEVWRQKGIGSLIVDSILKHEDFQDVYQWVLATKDAHHVYERLGFEVIKRPEMWMGIINPRPR